MIEEDSKETPTDGSVDTQNVEALKGLTA